jgi:regulator of sigma E protease
MSVILFILILGALIFVHELGHFLAAKKNGIRVDEFSVGFPPRLIKKKVGETLYSLNLIPFGGYVKIFGENPDEESLDVNAKDSFVNKSRWVQALVLVAGVVFNIVFAWFLFFIILMSGMPAVVTDDRDVYIEDVQVMVTSVFPESPAEEIGLNPGDQIIGISNGEISLNDNLNIEEVQNVIQAGNEVSLNVKSLEGDIRELSVTPATGIISDVPGIGISMERIGIRQLPIHRAFVEAFSLTGETIQMVFVGLGMLWDMISTGDGDLDQFSGPVGIVNLVSNASQFGFANLLSFTAVLSINLAILNILPFPALDGGRLLFLGIEGIRGKRLNPKFSNIANGVGFLILIGLMIVITINDVLKLF